MLEIMLTIIHVIVILFLILVVLVQGGNQGGVSAAFGGGNSSGFFGASGAASLLTKLTYGAASVFMVTSIGLTIIQGRGGSVGLKEKLEKASATEAPKEPAAEEKKEAQPAAATPAPAEKN